jgi:hypothetical protein
MDIKVNNIKQNANKSVAEHKSAIQRIEIWRVGHKNNMFAHS